MPGSTRAESGRRGEILQLLRELDRPASMSEISQTLGVHVNTVRFHLESLVANGQVERTTAERGSPGRPPQMFTLIRGMDPSGPRQYQALARVLLAGLTSTADAGRRALRAGRAWGRELGRSSAESADSPAPATPGATGPVEQLVQVLDQLGFAPDLQQPGEGHEATTIALHHCPFLELAADRSDVICRVHLGLMRGVLEARKAPVRVTRLDPFVEPDRCCARLSASA